jgi:hypothetical protein
MRSKLVNRLALVTSETHLIAMHRRALWQTYCTAERNIPFSAWTSHRWRRERLGSVINIPTHMFAWKEKSAFGCIGRTRPS